jgi:hypothetical protein
LLAKKQAAADRKALLVHRHREALQRTNDIQQDATLFEKVKLRLLELDAMIAGNINVIQEVVKATDSEFILNEFKDIVSQGAGAASTESKAHKMAKYVIGGIYTDVVAYKEHCEGLIDSMNVMMVSLFYKEYYSNDKDIFVLALIKKQIDDRALIVSHLNLQNMTLALNGMEL